MAYKDFPIAIASLFLILIMLFPSPGSGQIQPDSLLLRAEQLARDLLYRNHDSAYIRSYADAFAVRLTASSKYNFFRIADRNERSSLRYRPDRRINLGLGVAYKWFAVDLAFNLGVVERDQFENGRFFDFQGTVFTSKHVIGATYQYYLGYKLAGGSVNNEEIPESSKFREDIRSIRFGLNYSYALDYGRFSLKAPFVLNEIQRKSAGSFLIGVGFSMNILDADSSMVPSNLYPDFAEKLHFTDLNTSSLGFSFGYAYSLVLKEHFFLTLGFLPGFNVISTDYQTGVRQLLGLRLYPSFQTMNAAGYNGRKVFAAMQLIGGTDYLWLENKLRVDIGSGKIRLVVGYRFGVK